MVFRLYSSFLGLRLGLCVWMFMFEKLVLRFASACRSWIMYWLVFGLQLVLLLLLGGDCCLD